MTRGHVFGGLFTNCSCKVILQMDDKCHVMKTKDKQKVKQIDNQHEIRSCTNLVDIITRFPLLYQSISGYLLPQWTARQKPTITELLIIVDTELCMSRLPPVNCLLKFFLTKSKLSQSTLN